MKALVLTDDSNVKLPKYNKWKITWGRGIQIEKNPEFLSALKQHDLPIPTNDIEHEDLYKKYLRDFSRPAKFMFAGMFTEVRLFADELKKTTPSEIIIISGRYGKIHEHDEIIPYDFFIETKKHLKTVDQQFQLLKNLKADLEGITHLIIFLPKFYIEYFIENRWFDQIPQKTQIIIVSSKDVENNLSKKQQILVLKRKGVARIGKENWIKILKLFDDPKGREKK